MKDNKKAALKTPDTNKSKDKIKDLLLEARIAINSKAIVNSVKNNNK